MQPIGIALLWTGLAVLCGSCGNELPPTQYRGIDTKGWERQDSLCFSLDSLPRTATYVPRLHLRHLSAPHYPYDELLVLVEQRWVLPTAPSSAPTAAKRQPSYWPKLHPHRHRPVSSPDSLIAMRRDTLRFSLLPLHRDARQHGLALQATMLRLPPLSLPQGAHGRITVRHLMDRESLPGLHDLGFELLLP
ncbi:MAG: hypothetical protein Q4D66_01580 [Bacteroidales bacterium]|nr:hypothetical protein [Bacteroidales bacterium]